MIPSSKGQFPSLPIGLRTRFAPSPTGYLHLGHVASAIYVWGIARLHGAEILLRMEDHDQGRCRRHYEASILENLRWLGFSADIGVTDADKPSPYRQSNHSERYEEALDQLHASTYRCQCSRKDILERTGTQLHELWYDGYCRSIDRGPNIRAKFPREIQRFHDHRLGAQTQTPADQCGDLLLKDRDGFWTYNFAVTVDDIKEGINLIIRGEDILSATGRQLQLRQILGGPSIAGVHFMHHPLLRSPENAEQKLSKRDRSTSIGEWKAQGYAPEDLIGKAAFQLGLLDRETKVSAHELEGLFS